MSTLRRALVGAVLAVALLAAPARANITIGHADVVAIEGDSTFAPPYRYQVARGAIQRMRAQISPITQLPAVWPPPAVVTSKAWPPPAVVTSIAWPPPLPAGASSETGGPTSFNNAFPGDTCGMISTRLAADIARNPHITAWIVGCGINDAFGAVPLSTTLADMTTILNNIQASGVTKVEFSAPPFWGEQYPAGQNPNDGTLDALVAAQKTLVDSYPGFIFVNQRALFFSVEEPIYNTAANGFADPHGLFHGPFSLMSDPNAIHPIGNQVNGGSWFTSQVMLSFITVGP